MSRNFRREHDKVVDKCVERRVDGRAAEEWPLMEMPILISAADGNYGTLVERNIGTASLFYFVFGRSVASREGKSLELCLAIKTFDVKRK